MLRNSEIGELIRYIASKGITISEISKEIGCNRMYVGGVINGTMQHSKTEQSIREWFANEKDKDKHASRF